MEKGLLSFSTPKDYRISMWSIRNNSVERFWEEQPLSKMKNSDAYPPALSNKPFQPCILFYCKQKSFS